MNNHSSLKAAWTLSILAPASFLLAIIASSIYFSAQGQTNPGMIEQSVGNSMPVILAGFVAGGLFAGLRIRRGSIIPAYSAHLALNLVEFQFVLLIH